MEVIYNFLFSFYPVIPIFIILLYGYYEAGKLEFNRIEIFFDELPDDFDNFKILHISDLHSVRFGRLEKKICKLVRNKAFDIAAFTGDFIVRGVSRKNNVVESLKRILFHISAPSGIFGIRGNHEKNKFIRFLSKNTDINFLMERAVFIQRGKSEIWVAGVNRMSPLKKGRGQKSLNKALVSIPKESKPFIILLSHTPDYIPIAAEYDIPLVLAGDTHGGQICLPILGPLRNKAKSGKRFIKGLNKVSQTYIYTSKGVGSTGIPIRIFCPPEITLITLRKREKAFQISEK